MSVHAAYVAKHARCKNNFSVSRSKNHRDNREQYERARQLENQAKTQYIAAMFQATSRKPPIVEDTKGTQA
jgi:hypothetical protein